MRSWSRLNAFVMKIRPHNEMMIKYNCSYTFCGKYKKQTLVQLYMMKKEQYSNYYNLCKCKHSVKKQLIL